MLKEFCDEDIYNQLYRLEHIFCQHFWPMKFQYACCRFFFPRKKKWDDSEILKMHNLDYTNLAQTVASQSSGPMFSQLA